MSCSIITIEIDEGNLEEDLPAEATVDIGSLSLDPRNDIRKGTKDIWLMAFRALFEVSLVFLSDGDGTRVPQLTTSTTIW